MCWTYWNAKVLLDALLEPDCQPSDQSSGVRRMVNEKRWGEGGHGKSHGKGHGKGHRKGHGKGHGNHSDGSNSSEENECTCTSNLWWDNWTHWNPNR